MRTLQRAQGELLFFTHLCFLLVGFDNGFFWSPCSEGEEEAADEGLVCHPRVSRPCQLCPDPSAAEAFNCTRSLPYVKASW